MVCKLCQLKKKRNGRKKESQRGRGQMGRREQKTEDQGEKRKRGGEKEKFRPTSTQITFPHLGYRQNW